MGCLDHLQCGSIALAAHGSEAFGEQVERSSIGFFAGEQQSEQHQCDSFWAVGKADLHNGNTIGQGEDKRSSSPDLLPFVYTPTSLICGYEIVNPRVAGRL